MFQDLITKDVKSVLLVEPNFPIPNKSRNHKNFLPIGLLKIAGYLRTKDINIKLIRFDGEEINLDNSSQVDLDGNEIVNEEKDFSPDLICVTSIFTYWANMLNQLFLIINLNILMFLL